MPGARDGLSNRGSQATEEIARIPGPSAWVQKQPSRSIPTCPETAGVRADDGKPGSLPGSLPEGESGERYASAPAGGPENSPRATVFPGEGRTEPASGERPGQAR